MFQKQPQANAFVPKIAGRYELQVEFRCLTWIKCPKKCGVSKLSFCQNDCSMGGSFWQKDSLLHCKYLNARFECNSIVISIYSHYPVNQNAKSSDTKCFCIRIKRVMTVYENYNVIAFRNLQCTIHYDSAQRH